MARKSLQVKQNLQLTELIPLYGEQNTQCNALKKKVAELNGKIKTAIHNELKENQNIEVAEWTCKLSVEDSSTMNEDRLVEFAKKHNLDILYTKECVDFDRLESLIYNNKIEQSILIEMNSCKDASTREVLRVVKSNNKENSSDE